MDSKIFSLEQHRELKQLKEKEMQFKGYLSSLQQEELQYEANYIINKINDDNLSKEFILKSALLMDELAKRVTATQMANTINKFADNLKSKLESPVLQ